MRRFASLLLVLLVALTGISLGHARGQVLAGGGVVLCSGAALLPATGEGQAPLICPDMALSLMTAAAMPAPAVIAPQGAVPVEKAVTGTVVCPVAPVRAAQARGPPSVV